MTRCLDVKLVGFDLFDTLLDKEWFDFNRVADLLLRKHLRNTTRVQFDEWAAVFRKRYMADRNITNKESRFTDQLRFYESESGVRFDRDYQDLEWECFLACRGERLGPGVKEVLSYLKGRGYVLAVISNSIFSSKCLRNYLDMFGIGDFFGLVLSTADVGVRKPSPEVFRTACERLFVDTKDACFIGNNYEKDFIGAGTAGMVPIYYDRNHENRGCLSIHDMNELTSILWG